MAANGRHDFQGVASAALASAELLLPEWLPGNKRGNEWVGLRKANGGPGDSWKVNLDTGVWAHFGAGPNGSAARGGDLIDLYAALRHIDLGTACEQLAQQLGINDRGIPVLPTRMPMPTATVSKPRAVEPKSNPIPADAPPIPIHSRHGQHSALYRYGTAFYVARYDLPDGKEFCPWTWRNNKWHQKGYGDGKPLYRSEDLGKHTAAQVLIVEGEKCADMGASALPLQVVVSWCGGAKAVKGTDWSALKGRDVTIWPDADDAGRAAAADIVRELTDIAARARVMTLAPDTSQGWDIADAISEGMNEGDISDFIRDHITEHVTTKKSASPEVIQATPDESAFVSWSALGLDTNEGGLPHATLANASLILRMHPKFRGHVWYDTFTQKVYQDFKGIARQWRDEDDEDLTVFIQQSMKLNKFKLELVRQGVRHAARARSINSLTDWLDSLKWNGVEHLDTWLTDTLGVDLDEHTLAVSRKWPISMVARAYHPGCQVDTMPVLEGVTGLSKSSFVNALGSPWYASLPEAFGAKDFLQAIQGRWLIEIPDMTGFSHREHTHILATLSNRTDVYRASYGHHVEEHPRSSVFAATSETEDYLQDIRGRRRYWPLRCKHIDIDVLRGQREQLFAQAVHAYRAGEDWWKMPGKTDQEQRDRALPDIWSDKVLSHATQEWEYQQRSNGSKLITSADLLEFALDVKPNKQSQIERNRIARIMREGGWIQSRTREQRHWIKVVRKDGT